MCWTRWQKPTLKQQVNFESFEDPNRHLYTNELKSWFLAQAEHPHL